MDEHLLYIGGQWRPGRTPPDPATSPATGETVASVAVAADGRRGARGGPGLA
jgi:hypothetical protein